MVAFSFLDSFWMAGYSILSQLLIACGLCSIALRAGFCGENPHFVKYLPTVHFESEMLNFLLINSQTASRVHKKKGSDNSSGQCFTIRFTI
jgi:hypothetical protein